MTAWRVGSDLPAAIESCCWLCREPPGPPVQPGEYLGGDRLLQRRDRHRGACALLLLLYCAGWGCHPGPVRPRIMYCSTPAGRVAYSTSGAGPPLLFDSGWVSHLLGQLELYAFGTFVERLAERFTVIRYDKPGCGLSDGDGIDLSFDGQVAAALAVAGAVGADRFGLFGASQGGQLAAAIAARYPDRVDALVLYGMCASGSDLAPAAVRDSVVAVVAEMLEVSYRTDIRALLPTIQARTAVLHREADKGTKFELGREVAALIPGATLIPLPGSRHLFYHGDWPIVLEALLGFLSEPASTGPRLTGRELEVAGLVAEGLTSQAIARRLSVAARTAAAHVENIRRQPP